MAATSPLSYNAFVRQLGVMAVLQTQVVGGVVVGVDGYFNAEFIAQVLSYAELRIQRDIDLLPSKISKPYSTTGGTATLTLSAADFVTVLNGTVSGGALVGSQPLTAVAQEYIQSVYSSAASNGAPQYFAMIGGDAATGGTTSNILLLGPTPDAIYSVTLFGTARLPTLANQAGSAPDTGYTFISTYLPDLLLQASMIYVTEFQRNFGATSNDPAMGVSYEQQYQGLLAGAKQEEVRKKFWGPAWSSESPSPVASPSR